MSFLANHLWQSTVFAAMAGSLTLAFRRNRAAVRYGLWLAASLKFLLPFWLLTAAASHFAPVSPPAPRPIARALPAIRQISQPFEVALPVEMPMPGRWPMVLMAVWIGGSAIHLFLWWRRWLTVRAAVRNAARLPLAAPIPVLSTRCNIEPGVWGIFRPVLLMPEGLVERLSEVQFEAILAHELAHVRRRDNLTAAIHMLVEAIFWFHPLVWWMETRLIAERERACDEEVLGQCADPEAYADTILCVCRTFVESPLPCVSGVTGSDLRERIEAILTPRTLHGVGAGKKALLVAALVASIAAPILIGQPDTVAPAKFAVISIKKDESPGPWRLGMEFHPGGRVHGNSLPVSFLIAFAYDVPFQSPRLSGLPDWAMGERFMVDAAPDEGAIPANLSTRDLHARVRPMLQAMLADRFKLVMRRETREVPVYAITIRHGGTKLTLANIEEKDCTADSKVNCHNMHGGVDGMNGEAVTLDDVAIFASNWLELPVINATGLTKLYKFEGGKWGPTIGGSRGGGRTPDAENLDDPNGPTIAMAFRDLGLDLTRTKAPVEMYIVEHVERPTGN